MSKNHSWFMNHSNSLAVSIMTQKKCGSSCTLVNLVFVQLFRLFLWTRHSTYVLFDKSKNPLLQLWPKRESPAKHPDADQCKTLECNISQKKNQFQLSLTLGYCAKCIFNRSLTFGIRQRIWPLNKNGKTPLFLHHLRCVRVHFIKICCSLHSIHWWMDCARVKNAFELKESIFGWKIK